MSQNEIIKAILVDDELSILEIRQHCDLSEEVFNELIQLGLFKDELKIESLSIDAQKISRIQSASRLLHDLKVNAAGAVLALELLDEIAQLRQEIFILQK